MTSDMQHHEHIKQIVIQLHIDTPKLPKPKGSGGTDLYLCEGVVGGERRRLGLGPKLQKVNEVMKRLESFEPYRLLRSRYRPRRLTVGVSASFASA